MANKPQQTAIKAISKPLSEIVQKLGQSGYANYHEFRNDWEKVFIEHEKLFKRQIKKSFNDGCKSKNPWHTAEYYYHETYGK